MSRCVISRLWLVLIYPKVQPETSEAARDTIHTTPACCILHCYQSCRTDTEVPIYVSTQAAQGTVKQVPSWACIISSNDPVFVDSRVKMPSPWCLLWCQNLVTGSVADNACVRAHGLRTKVGTPPRMPSLVHICTSRYYY
jgi:hypothetical protein